MPSARLDSFRSEQIQRQTRYNVLSAIPPARCFRWFRLLVASNLLLASAAPAQSNSDPEITAIIENARQLVAVDAQGCLKYPKNGEIIVCGENPDNKNQRIFADRSLPDEDRIRGGEAISTKRAAACLSTDSMCKIYPNIGGMGFGYVPPPAIPLEEVLRGLPEPDMIVTNGENASPEL
jgi:hypothetical protein